MPRIEYESHKFGPTAMEVIRTANQICAEYQQQGLDLTLRQIYYQFVSRDLISNKQSEYKRLGSIINDARLAGLLDWDYIVDRTRNLRDLSHWETPTEIIGVVERQFRTDRWADQPNRVEVWIEKDALVGVLDAVCPEEDVPYFSCRGYTSQSEIWGAAQRIGGYMQTGQNVTVIHLGDHDPSGIDMTRDIEDRVRNFTRQDLGSVAAKEVHELIAKGKMDALPPEDKDHSGPEWGAAIEYVSGRRAEMGRFTINRIALNMDQVERYDPPPNPAKLTDSRSTGYIDNYGDESWELDALDPATLITLIRDAIEAERDEDVWEASTQRMERQRDQLTLVRENWDAIVAQLEGDQ